VQTRANPAGTHAPVKQMANVVAPYRTESWFFAFVKIRKGTHDYLHFLALLVLPDGRCSVRSAQRSVEIAGNGETRHPAPAASHFAEFQCVNEPLALLPLLKRRWNTTEKTLVDQGLADSCLIQRAVLGGAGPNPVSVEIRAGSCVTAKC
jgi:hypothetical protein